MKPEPCPIRPSEDRALRKPAWIRARIPCGEQYEKIRALVRENGLHTVCAEALCPNQGECWGRGTATFMILGDICTRNCGFCGVKSGAPRALDGDEPARVAHAVGVMNLKHAVITSVTRDDLPDGGAAVFAATVRAISTSVPGCRVEVLVPDFGGDLCAIDAVVRARPDVFGHNMETVPRLYPVARPGADFSRSLEILAAARRPAPSSITKSGIMVGLGESWEEVLEVMSLLRGAGCDLLTIGQYLAPTRSHLPVARYYTPEEFERLKEEGLRLGFGHVESGPLVRSSYRADSQAALLEKGL